MRCCHWTKCVNLNLANISTLLWQMSHHQCNFCTLYSRTGATFIQITLTFTVLEISSTENCTVMFVRSIWYLVMIMDLLESFEILLLLLLLSMTFSDIQKISVYWKLEWEVGCQTCCLVRSKTYLNFRCVVRLFCSAQGESFANGSYMWCWLLQMWHITSEFAYYVALSTLPWQPDP